MGYRYIAIGGIVPLKDRELLPVVDESNKVRRKDTRFHLLGVSRCHNLSRFAKQGVVSFDSTSPLRQAFKDDKDNYHTLDRTYIAVRVPQVEANPRVRRRIVAGELHHNHLLKFEQRCLRTLVRYDRDDETLDDALSSIREYDDALELTSTPVERYREVLEERPWKSCPCAICRDLGIHVILFRGAERNRRRGFHNIFSLYKRLEREIEANGGTS